MIVASLYPTPYDPRQRHDLCAAIVTPDRVYSYEEDKISTVKTEMIAKFAERSLFWGFKELGILPHQVDAWAFPTPFQKPDYDTQFHFFSDTIKAYVGSRADFNAWFDSHVHFVDHQICHASGAVFTSDFEETAFLCLDGGGDFGDPRNHIFGEYQGGKFNVIHGEFGYKNLGSFHSFVCDALGFRDNGKVTGLAAYGKIIPELYTQLRELLTIKENGVDFNRIRYARSTPNLAKFKPNEYERAKIVDTVPSETNVFRMSAGYLIHDVAATGEKAMQDTVMDFLKILRGKTQMQNLVLGGGLFQNVALNRVIRESGIFKNVHVPMMPGDAGMAFGAAMFVSQQKQPEKRTEKRTPYLGPSVSETEVESLVEKFRLNATREKELPKKVAELLAQGKVVGMFRGQGELGPRSLGNRSILADPRFHESKMHINQNLKRRDWFMPYAPAVLDEQGEEWFKNYTYSPYMHFTFIAKDDKKDKIPAAVHIDGSARVQSVKKHINPVYWQTIEEFRKLTGVPIVLNTSFNRHGIATISTARQAIEHLLEGCLDYLALGEHTLIALHENRILKREKEDTTDESLLLAADLVDRLKTLEARATPQQVTQYVSLLGERLGLKLSFDGSRYRLGDQSIDRGQIALLKKEILASL